jgi:hypothetical protein
LAGCYSETVGTANRTACCHSHVLFRRHPQLQSLYFVNLVVPPGAMADIDGLFDPSSSSLLRHDIEADVLNRDATILIALHIFTAIWMCFGMFHYLSSTPTITMRRPLHSRLHSNYSSPMLQLRTLTVPDRSPSSTTNRPLVERTHSPRYVSSRESTASDSDTVLNPPTRTRSQQRSRRSVAMA